MLILRSFLAALLSFLRSRAALELENLALRHQIGVLQRSAARRPKLTPWDRLLWIGLSRLWRDWYSALAIVRPGTVVILPSRWLPPALDLEGAPWPTRPTRPFG